MLANMAATVDVVSDGRLELGLGAGWNADESGAYGIELPPLRERFDRFDEGCEVIIGLLTQPQFSMSGAQRWNTPFTDAATLAHKREVLAGCQLAIIGLPAPEHRAAALEPIASALVGI